MTSPIDTYKAATGVYPANNKQWWIAKASSDYFHDPRLDPTGVDRKQGDFQPELLQKFYFGNCLAPRGHFIVNAFTVNRSEASGIADLPSEVKDTRPTTVAFFAGRAWYGQESTVYFSQVLDNVSKAGNCFQEADPTAEDISDLIATDGGVIPIPDAVVIVRMVPIANGLAVFARNGIWLISGGNNGFTATSFTVSKINSIGTDAPDTIVEATNGPSTQLLWWSKVGIQGMSQSDVASDQFNQTNLTQTTIQTFYNAIPDESRQNAKGAYDPATNTVQWVWGTNHNFFDQVLTLDLTLGAFYPWSFNRGDSNTFITGICTLSRLNSLDNSTTDTSSWPESFISFLIQQDDGTGFGYFYDPSFADLSVNPYTSYFITGYELLEDAMRRKEANYVFCYFRQLEGPWKYNSGDQSYELLNPGSCTLQVRWDWTNSPIANRWSQEIEAYRLRFVPYIDDIGNLAPFDNGNAVVVTKNKVRGNGKSIQYRFSCDEIGRNFDLLGWAVNYTGNTKP